MRIISKEKDYYDCGLQYGIDKEVTYVRNRKILQTSTLYGYTLDKFKESATEKEMSVYNFFQKDKGIRNIHMELDEIMYMKTSIIGFCGKLIPVFIFYKKEEKKQVSNYISYENKIYEVFYSSKDVLDFLKTNSIKHNRVNDILKFEEDVVSCSKYNFIFNEFKVPVFEISGSGIILNNSLKEFKFKNKMDPYTCFQQISMFVSYLNNPEEEVNIRSMSDKVIRDAKGFNNCSFKKRSDKRGRKCSQKKI